MTLGSTERAVLGFFPTSSGAAKAKQELLAKGYETVELDRVSADGFNADPEINNALTGRSTITGLTLFSAEDGLGPESGVLKGADPAVSGMADVGGTDVGARAFLVTVVTTEERLGQAEEIMQRHGASL